jgi:hypothetical protein
MMLVSAQSIINLETVSRRKTGMVGKDGLKQRRTAEEEVQEAGIRMSSISGQRALNRLMQRQQNQHQ